MSSGDCVDDQALKAAWKQFCRRLEEAGDSVFKETIPAKPLHRADAFRFLTQNLGQAFDLALETKNTRLKVIREGPWKLGFSPDQGSRVLYDLDSDPGETRTVARRNRKVVNSLLDRIRERERRLVPMVSEADPGTVSDRTEALRAIGYGEESSQQEFVECAGSPECACLPPVSGAPPSPARPTSRSISTTP